MNNCNSLPPYLKAGTIISQGSVYIVRGEKTNPTTRDFSILIDKKFGSWIVLDNEDLKIYASFIKPKTFADTVKNWGDNSISLIVLLYQLGMVKLNGKRVQDNAKHNIFFTNYLDVNSLSEALSFPKPPFTAKSHRKKTTPKSRFAVCLSPGDTDKSNTTKGLSFIALHLLKGCNFNCRYCYNSSGVNTDNIHKHTEQNNNNPDKYNVMPLEIAKSIITKTITESSSPSLQYDFLGGEPLLAFDLIKEIMEFAVKEADKYGKKVTFLMQTNGSLLTEEKVKILAKYKVGVGVSLDGPEEVHNANRVDISGHLTHKIVTNNYKNAEKMGLTVSPLAVITNPKDYVKSLNYFVEELKTFQMRFNFFSNMGRARENCKDINADPKELSQEFLNMTDRALELAKFHARKLIIADLCYMLALLVNFEVSHICMHSPCKMGREIASFDPQGKIYACEEYEEKTKEALYLGRLDQVNLDSLSQSSENLKILQSRRVENIPKCSQCPIAAICRGGCTHKTLAYFGEILREDPMCQFYKQTYIGLMWKIWQNPEIILYLVREQK